VPQIYEESLLNAPNVENDLSEFARDIMDHGAHLYNSMSMIGMLDIDCIFYFLLINRNIVIDYISEPIVDTSIILACQTDYSGNRLLLFKMQTEMK